VGVSIVITTAFVVDAAAAAVVVAAAATPVVAAATATTNGVAYGNGVVIASTAERPEAALSLRRSGGVAIREHATCQRPWSHW
jgi:hypothetical protein